MRLLLDTHVFLWAIADAARLAQLPPIHKDPFDRILVAQAQERGLVFATADPVISQYSVTTLRWA